MVEEVKQGMYFSDRCQFCGEFGEKTEPYLCEKCRDRIFEWLNSKGWSILQGDNQLEPKPDGGIKCPFCGQADFDQMGLKYHLNNYCEAYQKQG